MDIQSYIAELEAKQSAKLKAESEREAQADAEREAERVFGWQKFNAAIPNLLPEIIRPYFSARIPDDPDVNNWLRIVCIEVPDCTTIHLYAKPVESGYELVQDRDYGISFATYELSDWREGPEKVELDRYVRAIDLDDALLLAHRAYLRLKELEKQAAESKQEYEKSEDLNALRRSAVAEAEAESWLKHQKQIEAEKIERISILDGIANDPVALLLAQVMLAVKNERDGYRESIESLQEHAGSLEEWHADRVEKLERSLSEAKRAAENYRNEKDDLESDLDRAQREAKKLKRQFA